MALERAHAVTAASPAASRQTRLFSQLLTAIGVGILAGVLLGESTHWLRIVSTGFVRLLQVNVLPYLLGTLIASLGARGSDEMKRIAKGGAGLLLVSWALTLVLVVFCRAALPPTSGEPVFDEGGTADSIDWLELYIPSNLFHALSNNLVPAVVLFGILAGVALGQVEPDRKAILLQALEAFNEAMARVSRLILRLTPVGLFAMTAVTAGSIRLEDILRLQMWLHLYAGGALLLTLWILPGLVAWFADVPYGAFLRAMRTPIVTAAAAGDVLVVLPLVAESARDLLTERGADRESVDGAVGIAVPLLYNFPHTGKILSLAFLPFAAWFSGGRLGARQLLLVVSAGPLSLFGNINAAMSFLLDLLRLPADLVDLFTVSSVINSRFGSMAAAAHVAALSIVLATLLLGRLRVTLRLVLRYLLITAALIAAFLLGTRGMYSLLLPPAGGGLETLTRLQLRPPLAAGVTAPVAVTSPSEGRRLREIRQRGVLRVGYFDDALPWAYVDAGGASVGHDVEAAHRLARDLRTALQLVHVDRESVVRDLDSGRIDILMSGFTATVPRAEAMELSQPYGGEHIGFLVRDFLRTRFETREALEGGRGLVIAIPPVEGASELVSRLMPTAAVRRYTEIEPGILDSEISGLLMPVERAYYWSRVHPEMTAVRPADMQVSTAMVYAMPRGEHELCALVDRWLAIRRASGDADEAYAYWVRGRSSGSRQRRWSVIDAAREWLRR